VLRTFNLPKAETAIATWRRSAVCPAQAQAFNLPKAETAIATLAT